MTVNTESIEIKAQGDNISRNKLTKEKICFLKQ
jgi:hypothetical protein